MSGPGPRIARMNAQQFLSAIALAGCCTANAADTSPPPDAMPIEPKVQLTVIDDGSTRIEELKVRGQTRRISVKPKGAQAYEIVPADAGRDNSDGASSQRGAAGQRVWHILSF